MILFKNNITRLSVQPKHEVRNYRIGVRSKRVGFKYGVIPAYEKRPALYCYGDFDCFLEDYNNPNHYIEDDKVYMVPHVDIYMNDRSYSSTVYFKTEEELNNYVKEIVKDNPYIEI
jgi:hypothetical protein